MDAYYTAIKLLHIGCVLLSGGIFSFRGLLMLAGSRWCNHALLKWPSYINDSILLTAGLLLMQLTQQYPITHDWLSVKLLLLIIYIVLGVFALRAAPSRTGRALYYLAALAVYLFMLSIARSHHPLGVFTTGTLY